MIVQNITALFVIVVSLSIAIYGIWLIYDTRRHHVLDYKKRKGNLHSRDT